MDFSSSKQKLSNGRTYLLKSLIDKGFSSHCCIPLLRRWGRGRSLFSKRKSRLEFLTFICHSRDLSIVLRANAAYLYCDVAALSIDLYESVLSHPSTQSQKAYNVPLEWLQKTFAIHENFSAVHSKQIVMPHLL